MDDCKYKLYVNFVAEITVTTNNRNALRIRSGYDKNENTENLFIAGYSGGLEYSGVFAGESSLGALSFAGGGTVATNTFYMDLTSLANAYATTEFADPVGRRIYFNCKIFLTILRNVTKSASIKYKIIMRRRLHEN